MAHVSEVDLDGEVTLVLDEIEEDVAEQQRVGGVETPAHRHHHAPARPMHVDRETAGRCSRAGSESTTRVESGG